MKYFQSLIVLIISFSNLSAQSWTDLELSNSVKKYKSFLVIRDSDGSCYVKQSYDKDLQKMELAYNGYYPYLTIPFLNGIKGDIFYWVDEGSGYSISLSELKKNDISPNLNQNILPEMKKGRSLYVRVNPVGFPPRIQRFSLMGFTAALKRISRKDCLENKGDSFTSNLEVNFENLTSGKAVVSGKTSLPDGTQLMISIRAKSIDYFAQDKVKVSSGKYISDPFSDLGKPLSKTTYIIGISSSYMDLQPKLIRNLLGDSGEKIPKDIRKEAPDGSYTVNYQVKRTLK